MMDRAALLLLVTTLLAPASALDLTGWTPTCQGQAGAVTIHLPDWTSAQGFSADLLSAPSGCTEKRWDVTSAHNITSSCIEPGTKSVTLALGHSSDPSVKGGRDYHLVNVTCRGLGPDGIPVKATVDFQAGLSTPAPSTVSAQQKYDVEMKLVKASSLSDVVTSGTPVSPSTPLQLGQEDVYLRLRHSKSSGGENVVLLPRRCSANSSSHTAPYKILDTDPSTCLYDKDIFGAFTMNAHSSDKAHDYSYAQFYPFKFTSGGPSITLTCEVLVCMKADTNSGNKKCQTVADTLTTKCDPHSQISRRRRRRSAEEEEPHTRVLEVTYSVVGLDPDLQGSTAAAGAGAAISVPLLAGVVSLWML